MTIDTNPQPAATSLGCEGDQNFATPKCAFWDTDFKLVLKRQKTQKEPLTIPFLV